MGRLVHVRIQLRTRRRIFYFSEKIKDKGITKVNKDGSLVYEFYIDGELYLRETIKLFYEKIPTDDSNKFKIKFINDIVITDGIKFIYDTSLGVCSLHITEGYEVPKFTIQVENDERFLILYS